MSWPKRMPIVEVLWVDSHTRPGWCQADAVDALEQCACKTAGYLFRDTEESVVIMQNQSDAGGVGEAMVIPKPMVKSMRVWR